MEKWFWKNKFIMFDIGKQAELSLQDSAFP